MQDNPEGGEFDPAVDVRLSVGAVSELDSNCELYLLQPGNGKITNFN